jgi:broad specificity phosphatase PhoE
VGKNQVKESGKKFFEDFKEILENYKLEIISSDLLRARQTAELFVEEYIIFVCIYCF